MDGLLTFFSDGRIAERKHMGLIVSLFVGAVAGWLAGKIMHTDGSLIRNIVLGIVGGMVGGVVLGLFGIWGDGIIGNIIVSAVGACIIIWLVNQLGGRI